MRSYRIILGLVDDTTETALPVQTTSKMICSFLKTGSRTWRIKMDEDKSVHANFDLDNEGREPVSINQILVLPF